VTLVARTSGDPLPMTRAVQEAIWSIDPLQAADRVSTLDRLLVVSVGDQRFRTVLLALFALVGLGVALVGVHGVTAAAVLSRTREMGVRLALGAEPAQLVRGILADTMWRVAAGAAGGIVAFIVFGRLLQRLLYQPPALPAGVIAGAVAVMCGGALAAAYLRARPLAALSPVTALRGVD
jgi:putative ABC transport system permease protein